jgi:hypothetical protein
MSTRTSPRPERDPRQTANLQETPLVVHGLLANGEKVIVCLEAKAGEDLDRTVDSYRKDAHKKRTKGEPTNAPERIAALLKRYVPFDPAEECVGLVRYQFLSALAGTEAETGGSGAEHAVLMLHDFITDQRSADKTTEHAVDWHRFCTRSSTVNLLGSVCPGPLKCRHRRR